MIALLLAAALAIPELAPPPRPVLPSGYYEFSGTIVTPAHAAGTYRGIALITEDEQGFRVLWLHTDGTPCSGHGMIANGRFVVGGSVGPARNIASYEIKDGGKTLTGTWMGNGGKSGTETFKFLKAIPKEF